MTTMASPELQGLLDKQAIAEVLYRYARGLDRMDMELAASCYHPGATDDHAPLYKGSASGFLEWLWPVHAATHAFRHVVTNITIALDGDRAGSECYWTLTIRLDHEGHVVDLQSGGRYVDMLARIDGAWGITHRQSIREWSRIDAVPATGGGIARGPLIAPNNPEAPELLTRRDRDDYSYRVLGG